jgi:hypothetical protein
MALVTAAVFAFVAARLPRAATGFIPGVLAALASLGLGFVASVLVTPDWSPLSLVLAYLPFVAVAAYAFLAARRFVLHEREQG